MMQRSLSWYEVTHEVIITDTSRKTFEAEVKRVLGSNSKDSNRLVLMWDDPRVFGRVLVELSPHITEFTLDSKNIWLNVVAPLYLIPFTEFSGQTRRPEVERQLPIIMEWV